MCCAGESGNSRRKGAAKAFSAVHDDGEEAMSDDLDDPDNLASDFSAPESES